MSEFVTAKMTVTGVVQGVGFRWFVVRAAEKLDVNGWTRNRFDGAVEIEAEGTRGAVEALIREVRIGPRFATVAGVNIEWLQYEAKYKNFDVRF